MHRNSTASTAVLLMTVLQDNILIDPLIIVQALGSQKKEFEHFHPWSSELHSLKNSFLLFKHPVHSFLEVFI